MTNGIFTPTQPLSRAGDLRSVQPFLRELEAVCRRRGFVLEGNAGLGMIVTDLDQADLPGCYAVRLSGKRTNSFTAICWRPGRIPR